MARPGTLAAVRAADRESHTRWYVWQLAIRAHGADSPQAAEAETAYTAAAQIRAATATAMHAKPVERNYLS